MAITLAGQSLPDPQGYSVSPKYRGKGQVMSDGTTKFDLVYANDRRTFVLRYVALNATQKAALEAAWYSLRIATGLFVDYDAGSYTVTRSASAPDIIFDAVATASGVHWAVTVTLVED